MNSSLLTVLCCLWFAAFAAAAEPTRSASPASGVAVSFQLPPGQIGNYLVTLAIVDAHDPDWIVSTFVAGARREVTAENQGKFTETWNGLDDNFMPVPPGEYAVKGIYMP